METTSDSFLVQAIGYVERPDGLSEGGVEQDTAAVIRIRPEWIDQLAGLEAFSHLVVAGWLDRAERRNPGAGLMRPEGRDDIPEVGVFATRSPRRPNPLGLCYPRLEKIDGDALHVRGLDFWANTPIVDIKGYFPRDEMRPQATVPEWLTKLWLSHDLEQMAAAADALASMETSHGPVVIRHSVLADAVAAYGYVNALSREQTFVTMQGEQRELSEVHAHYSTLQELKHNGEAVHIVAMAGGELVGTAQTRKGSGIFGHMATLGISVAAAWRGLGIGRVLMEKLLDETSRVMPDVDAIQLECFASNPAAIALYESFGFRECGRIPNKIKHRGEYVDEIIMIRASTTAETERVAAEPVPEPFATVVTDRGSVVFRAGQMSDAPAALAYINELSAEKTFILMQGEQLTLFDEIAFFRGLLSRRQAGDAVMIVAVSGDEIVGIAQYAREEKVMSHVARLGISIGREWRGHGLGRKLMEVLLAETEQSIPDLRTIQLECFGTNERAIAMYQSFGFVECGRIPGKIHHLGQDIDEVIMTRPVVQS